MQRADSFEKTLMLGKIEGRRRKGWQRIRWLDGITHQRTWVWVDSGSWWWTGKPGVLQFMGSQIVRHDWVTELNWRPSRSIHIFTIGKILLIPFYGWEVLHWVVLQYYSLYINSAIYMYYIFQFSSVAQSCPTLCDPMNRSTPGLPVHHQLLEFIQTHVHRVSDAIQPSYLLSSPSPPAPNPWWTACFHILAIVNNAMKNIRMHVSFWIQCFHILWISFC